MLGRFNLMIAFLLVICALGLVTSQHRARKLFIDLERAQTHALDHEVRWNQLQVEQTELAKVSLIDSRARSELGMQAVPADRTLHLSVDPVTRSVSLSQPWIERPTGARLAGVRAAATGRKPDKAGPGPGSAGPGPGVGAKRAVPVKGERR
jgi:cell division protein FtsL